MSNRAGRDTPMIIQHVEEACVRGRKIRRMDLIGIKQIMLALTVIGTTALTLLPRPSLAQVESGQADAVVSPRPPPGESGYMLQSREQLEQLTAPIALYPDSLVAQILAASTFPAQVVEADRWLTAHPDLKGDALARAVDQQRWDPSVKALAAFPSVLGNMDKNIDWTSSLGDSYYNQQEDVMSTIQAMRERAMQAGTLKTTDQQTVVAQDSTIVIQPTNPDTVFVPAYDPWLVYGSALAPWSGWYPYPGVWYSGPYLSFGLGFGMGPFSGFGWGWPNWGCNWHAHHHGVLYGNHPYHSRSTTFYNRNAYYRGGGARRIDSAVHSGRPGGRTDGHGVGGGHDVFNRPGGAVRPFGGSQRAMRGYGAPEQRHSGAFGGYGHGGVARSYSSHGRMSSGAIAHGGGRAGGGFGGGHGHR